MAYATLDQLVSLFGADEIRTLSDRQGTGELDEAVISDALERASSEVDSYLADRYATPLSDSDPIPPVVVSITGDIARYRLTGGDIRDTDPIRERYTKALNWLRDVADGKAGIPGLPKTASVEIFYQESLALGKTIAISDIAVGDIVLRVDYPVQANGQKPGDHAGIYTGIVDGVPQYISGNTISGKDSKNDGTSSYVDEHQMKHFNYAARFW